MEAMHIVAIIGAVTGLIGCLSGLYATYRLWHEKPKINIHIDAAYHYCLLEGGPGEQKPLVGANQKSGCEVRLHIRNNGSRPTTMEDFQTEFEIPKDSIGYSYHGLIYGPAKKPLNADSNSHSGWNQPQVSIFIAKEKFSV